ncbi:MAG: resolvase [Candidatus Saganbacteria bacterium]|nr:resolvase [Candidatus Saganbacteria bacterium]
MKPILAIDPGKDKCGIAVISDGKTVLEKKVIPTITLKNIVSDTLKRFEIETIVLGSGTHSKIVKKELAGLNRRIVLFPEKFTTLDARKRYWAENPPKGLLVLVPEGLRLPPRPYDDYAAVLLGERFLENPR